MYYLNSQLNIQNKLGKHKNTRVCRTVLKIQITSSTETDENNTEIVEPNSTLDHSITTMYAFAAQCIHTLKICIHTERRMNTFYIQNTRLLKCSHQKNLTICLLEKSTICK